jgi:hypothetical protein
LAPAISRVIAARYAPNAAAMAGTTTCLADPIALVRNLSAWGALAPYLPLRMTDRLGRFAMALMHDTPATPRQKNLTEHQRRFCDLIVTLPKRSVV